MSVAEERKLPLLLEFEQEYTLYAAKPPNTNWWTDFFKQPADVTHRGVCLRSATREEFYSRAAEWGPEYDKLVWNRGVNRRIVFEAG